MEIYVKILWFLFLWFFWGF